MGTRSRAGRTFSIVFYILCFLFGGYQNDTIFDLVAYPDDLVVSSSPVYHLAWAQKVKAINDKILLDQATTVQRIQKVRQEIEAATTPRHIIR